MWPRIDSSTHGLGSTPPNPACKPALRIVTLPLAARAGQHQQEAADIASSVETEPRRVLIVRPSALGDVCRTVPALVSLKRRSPGAVIDWVVRDVYLDAIRAHPDLSEAIPFPRSRFSAWWRSPRAGSEMKRWFRGLRERGYDIVFDLQGLGRSALITRATGAARRVGFANAREWSWLACNVRHGPPAAAHVVDQMLELLEREGVPPVRDMRLYVPPDDLAWWRAKREQRGLADEPYAVFAPTSRWGCKRWPAERWPDLIPPLKERGIRHIVLIGAPNERGQVAPLLATASLAGVDEADRAIVDLIGATSVGGTMAVIAGAAVVIANDSAPLHMAVGLSRPLVALFGPTDPAFVGPYGCDRWVVRAVDPARDGEIAFRDLKDDDRFMRRIESARVVERMLAALDEAGAPRAECARP
jgi:heptosyltransferase-1